MRAPRITIFNEFRHERRDDAVRDIYPDGIHVALAAALKEDAERRGLPEPDIRYALLDEPEHGFAGDVLETTDTLIWWGHEAHADLSDAVAQSVQQAVLSGMGLIVLHSAHFSKPFRLLMGTNCSLHWREADDHERLWNLEPAHPVLEGIPDSFVLEQEEMYGERFDVPAPDEVLLLSWFSGGEVFRSLCTWRRGHGRVVYFRPGHETYPTYYDQHVRRIIANAARWTVRALERPTAEAPNAPVPPERERRG